MLLLLLCVVLLLLYIDTNIVIARGSTRVSAPWQSQLIEKG